MKVGLKVLTTDPVRKLEERSFADFMEVFAVPGFSAAKFVDYDMEYVIHAAHSQFNVNPAGARYSDHTRRALKEAIEAADLLNAKIIIVHPGYLWAHKDSKSRARSMLAAFNDERIVLENLPIGPSERKPLTYDYRTMRPFASMFSNNICLDFAHASETAFSKHLDLKSILAGLLRFNVKIFHISDGFCASCTDFHLNLGEGDFDIASFKRTIEKSDCKQVTLETGLDIQKQRGEYEWLKS